MCVSAHARVCVYVCARACVCLCVCVCVCVCEGQREKLCVAKVMPYDEADCFEKLFLVFVASQLCRRCLFFLSYVFFFYKRKDANELIAVALHSLVHLLSYRMIHLLSIVFVEHLKMLPLNRSLFSSFLADVYTLTFLLVCAVFVVHGNGFAPPPSPHPSPTRTRAHENTHTHTHTHTHASMHACVDTHPHAPPPPPPHTHTHTHTHTH